MYIHNTNKNLKSILGVTFRHFQIYLVNAMVDIRACVLHFAPGSRSLLPNQKLTKKPFPQTALDIKWKIFNQNIQVVTLVK